ncbi:uncharacterized protein LOC101863055 [Aplysia californica]|uniref:Uncharacterized protein LOC101863055 n=1 Tax=Aplysia californica TaxID=6500 RepID=A0ABM1A921_APLCA|nr:uncharacterized protein LOC101863055 [Aplysia californica]
MDSAHGRGRQQAHSGAVSQSRDHPYLDLKTFRDDRTALTTQHDGRSSASRPNSAHPSLQGSDRGHSRGGVAQEGGGGGGGGRGGKRGGGGDGNDSLSRTEKSQSGATSGDSKVHGARSKKSKELSSTAASDQTKSGTSRTRRSDATPSSAGQSQTPKEKRRARSASRPRDQPRDQGGHARQVSSPATHDVTYEKEANTAQKDGYTIPHTSAKQQAEQRSFSFDKIAMAVGSKTSNPEHYKEEQPGFGGKSNKTDRDRKMRSASAPREVKTKDGERAGDPKRKTHARHLSADLADDSSSRVQSKSMQRNVTKQLRKKGQGHPRSEQLSGDISLEGVTSPHVPASVSAVPIPSSSSPDVHAIARPTSLNPNMAGAPNFTFPREPAQSKSRNRMQRGYVERDQFDQDYDMLNPPAANTNSRIRSYTPDYNSKQSVREPLLPRNLDSDSKLNLSSKDSKTAASTPRTASTSYIHTFPRTTKQHLKDPSPTGAFSSLSAERTAIIRRDASPSSEKTHRYSSNQLGSPDRAYSSSLPKVPSQSSFTSSDARSDVCLDLPDVNDLPDEDDLYLREVNDRVKVKLGLPNAPYQRIVHLTQSSLCFSVFINTLIIITSFLLLWPLLALVIVLVPVVLILKRFFSWFCCCSVRLWGRCCICLCHTHLTSSEVVWLGKRHGNAVAQSLLVLQKGLDIERIRNLLDSRLLSVENRHGHKMYPRFTQKVVEFCCGHAWVPDRHFSVSRHVFSMPGYIETLEDLQQFISKMAAEPMSLEHPLWEVQVLHNFREPRDTVLLFRMHMCLTDGVSIVHILENALVDSQKASSQKNSFSSEATNTSPFKVLFSGPLTFISRYLCAKQDHNVLHGRHTHPSGETAVAWSEPFSLSAAMRVKQVARCTLSELLLSVIAGNIRTYLQVSGTGHPYNVKCALPVDFQSLDGGPVDMENKYSMVVLPLPTNTEGAIPRLWEIKYKLERFKSSPEAAIVNGARWLTCCLLPVSLFQRLWRKIYSRCTLLVANLAGPTSTLKFDSREVKCMMYWVPPLDQVTVTVSFLTYADQVRMAVISDRSVLPNPDLLTRDFIHKLETLSKLLAHRRIPGESSASRHESLHLLSSFTLDDLTAEQIQLEMSLVQQELHDMKLQLEAGPRNHISHNDTQLMQKIEALKERSRELLMHLRRRKAEESESAVILSDDVKFEQDDLDSEFGDRQQRPFRRRTLSLSSRLSTASVSSTARPLSTASTSNLPSPVHAALPSWPEGDPLLEEMEETRMSRTMLVLDRMDCLGDSDDASPVAGYSNAKGRYHNVLS